MIDYKSPPTLGRWPRSALFAALLLFLSCVPFDTYSTEFRRSAGWKDHDGGGSTWIPAVGNGTGGRSLWLFGDGAFWRSGYTANPAQFSGNGCTYAPGCPEDSASKPWIVDPNVLPLVGNTIAVHGWTGTANPWDTPSNITFYGRKKAGATACGADATHWNANCPVARMMTASDIPSDPDVLNKAGGFIPKAHNTGQGETLPNHTDEYIWPKAAVYVKTPTYPAGYVVPDLFKSYAATTPQPFLVMGYQRKGPGANLQGLGFSIVTNIAAGDPSTWTYRGISEKIPIDPVWTDTAQNLSRGFGIAWGNALYYDGFGDRIRIYGEIYQVNPRPTGSACLANAESLRQCYAKDMVLAVALNSHDIVEPSRWWYAYSDNSGVTCTDSSSVCRPCQTTYPTKPEKWSACYAPIPPSSDQLKAQLKHVADNIAGDFSVDKVCYDQPGTNGRPSLSGEDGCAFVLTHGAWRTANGCRPSHSAPECALCVDDVTRSNMRWMMIRTTADDLSWPPASHGNYGSVSGKQSTFVSDVIGDDWDRAQLCGENKGRQVRQLQAHDELSPAGGLAISYYINGARNMTQNLWTDGDTSKLESARHGNLRFGALPLNNFRPWCEATGTCPGTPQASCAPPAQNPCCGAVDQACCSGNTCATGLSCQDFFGAKVCWPPPHS